MANNKELEIKWYRDNVVPYYTDIVELRLAREAMARKIKEKEQKKGGTDVPKLLRD